MKADVRVDAIVTFRDANEPRPLGGRLIATAHRHPDGWSLYVPDADLRSGHPTVDEIVATITRTTGIQRVLMIWTEVNGV